MLENLNNTLENILRKDKKYIAENGKILKTKVYEDTMNMDNNLIKLLISNDKIKEIFFTDIEGILIFDKQKFIWFIDSKDFLPDSYTSFKNKIGLIDRNRNYISNNNDVVLAFPFKDCFLEGGQNKEDQKRKEIMYNEIIASEDIRRMLSPKVFTNAKRYTKNCIEENITLKKDDNLIIKGNNLIVLATLLEKLGGGVKCIYIDPPYNTGSDSFNYNDNFNHSTWLTFMKNRLELAKKLLTDDGSIFINLDYNEVHYCKVLMDDIFGRENFQREIIWRIGWVSGYKTSVNNYIRNHDTILFYSKNKEFYFNKQYILNSEFKNLVKKDKVKSEFEKLNIDDDLQDKLLNIINYKTRPERYPLEDVWNANEYDDLNSIAIVSYSGESVSKMLKIENDIKGQKSEKLIERIIKNSTMEGDTILDFHLGSGTTAAVAHKMGRRYIGIEQMDYIEDIVVERLKKVINGEQGGISKAVNWQGGGSFVYCELKENSYILLNKIKEATEENIKKVKDEIYKDERIIPYITREELEKANKDFENLKLEDKKKILIDLVDKNKLYVNYSDMEDEEYSISENEKIFTNSFYKGDIK